MARKTDIAGDGDSRDANQAVSITAAPPPGQTEIHPRRTDPPLLSGSTAGDLASGSPAPFIELGSAVQAVVLRLANSRFHLRVLSQAGEEEGPGER